MRHFLASLFALLWLAGPVWAHGATAEARLDPAASSLRDTRAGGLRLELALSRPVPWRVFTLEEPRRLVLDVQDTDWNGASEALIKGQGASDLRMGRLRPGWSRMVIELTDAQSVHSADMQVDEISGAAVLAIVLRPTSDSEFSAAAGAPVDDGWGALATYDPTAATDHSHSDDDGFVVAIDPGHGGIDPGAVREGLKEAPLMLMLAQEVAEALARHDGVRPVLLRQSDDFVPLSARMSLARAAGADVFLSLHADALELDQAAGASVYVLSAEAQGSASARLVERHDRGDLLAGVDLEGQDDTLATALIDLARQETRPQSLSLQQALIAGFAQAQARLNSNPDRDGELAVLMAADFPSVLIEAGFLSNAADRRALTTPEGRAPIVTGIVTGLMSWRAAEEERAALKRR